MEKLYVSSNPINTAQSESTTQPQMGVQPALETTGIELVFGLVGPTGVDLNRLCTELTIQLQAVSYEAVTI